MEENNLNDKINKRIIFIGMICTIIPLGISTSSIIKYILSYLPMLIGYMLYFEEYKKYSDKQKKLFKTAVYISIMHIFAGMWGGFIINTHTSTFSIGFDELIAYSIFYISYFVHRIFSMWLCINVLKDKKDN